MACSSASSPSLTSWKPWPSSIASRYLAESAGHHPDIDIRYNRVRLALVSHDAGGITARDVAMATQLSADSTVAHP